MRFVFIFIVFFSVKTNAQESLEKYKWKHRIIAVYAESKEDSLAKEQRELLMGKDEIWDELKVKCIFYYENFESVLGVLGEKTIAVDSSKNLHSFEVRLIGLDGSVKYSAREPQPARVFVDLINKMPMRRAELRRKKG